MKEKFHFYCWVTQRFFSQGEDGNESDHSDEVDLDYEDVGRDYVNFEQVPIFVIANSILHLYASCDHKLLPQTSNNNNMANKF